MGDGMLIGQFEATVKQTVDGYYYAFLEEHPDFMMMGATPEEAIEDLQELIRGYNEDVMNMFLN